MKLLHGKIVLAAPLLSLAFVISSSSFAAAPDEDKTETPGQQACENSHAPTGSPSLAENENAQGDNPQANTNAQGSRADENQGEQGAANSRADLAQAGDDCLDVNGTIREQNEDARGQGTGNDPGDRDADDQTRNPQD